MADSSQLAASLQAAVALQYKELGLPGRLNEYLPELGKLSQLISTKGAVLLAGGGRKGEAAEAFNAVARGIAILSCIPGGVKLFGQRWVDGGCRKEGA